MRMQNLASKLTAELTGLHVRYKYALRAKAGAWSTSLARPMAAMHPHVPNSTGVL